MLAHRLACVGQRRRGRGRVVEHLEPQPLGPAFNRTPPRALISFTASRAPLEIEFAIHGSVLTGALTTTGTVSLSDSATGERETDQQEDGAEAIHGPS